MANLRLVLDVEVQHGNQIAASSTASGLWILIDSLPQECWPAFLRGDIAFGTDGVMGEAEQGGFPTCLSSSSQKNETHLIKKLKK